VRSTINYDKLLFCVLLQDVSQYIRILCNVIYFQTQLIESIITVIIVSFNLVYFSWSLSSWTNDVPPGHTSSYTSLLFSYYVWCS